MANLNTLDLNNKPSGQIELNDQILETEYHPQAIKQAVVAVSYTHLRAHET